MDVGFIGLGSMGKAMAANLLKAGHHVRVWNRSAGPAEELAGLGAEVADSPSGAFRGDTVITMLADDNAVRSVVVDGKLIENAPDGVIHVNMATISVAFVKELVALHEKASVPYVAAPVFGRTEVAIAGNLNILAAGDGQAIDRVQPLLDAMGQKTWRLGDAPERANVVKISGNFMLAAAIETMAEAMALARGYGIPEGELLDVLTGTLFPTPVYKNYGALIANRQFEPAAFRLRLGMKDVNLALTAGEMAHVPMPFASVLRENHIDAVAHGDGDKDWSAASEVAFRRAGIERG